MSQKKIRMNKKVLDQIVLKETIESLRKAGKKIVFTNGVFDILHVGHLSLLEKAKTFGDVLVVGVNSDLSVKAIKGESRPINNQNDRTCLLAGFEVVDYITVFEEQTPCEIISYLTPNIHVKGGDYNPDDFENMPEAKIVKGYGGEIKIINIIPGKSSTDLITKMSS